MPEFNININDFIKFLEKAGFEIVDTPEGQESGLYIDGKRVEDAGELLKECFNTPITCEECEDEQ